MYFFLVYLSYKKCYGKNRQEFSESKSNETVSESSLYKVNEGFQAHEK